jgi:glycosyltransferase involved in cell wall biosynthesis
VKNQEPKKEPQRLPKPVRITEQVWPEGAAPVMSIWCITYNHSNFISDAIEGFLMQETTFPVEIFIHDDASADGTAEIVREYAAKHPQLFWTVLQSENQWSKGSGRVLEFLKHQRGLFVALCEGDDYWTYPLKLQKQVEYLERHTAATACFHDAVLVNEAREIIQDSYFDSTNNISTQKDVIESLHSKEPTCSLVFRSSCVKTLPAWFLRRSCDLYLDILLTMDGGQLHFMRENMAAYRRHGGGVWSGTTAGQRIVELIVRFELLLLEEYFEVNFGTLIRSKIAEFSSLLLNALEVSPTLAQLEKIVEEQSKLLAAYDQAPLRSFVASVKRKLLRAFGSPQTP